jgi:type II secretory pathway component PulF
MDKKAKENILTNLKMPSAFYPVIIMIIFLIIMLSLIFFKVPINFTSKPLSKSQNEIIANVFVILFFTLIVVILSFMLLPNFKDFKELFQQISSVTYVLLYTIFLILFLTLMPDETLDSYAIYITPITIVLGLFCFYKAAKTNYIDKFNINYERIKTIIMIFYQEKSILTNMVIKV